MPAPEAVQRGGFEQVGVREAVLLTFGVDAPSEVVLAQDGSGSVQAVLEEKRDRRLPGGRVAAEHDDHDAKVETRADLEWASCMRLVLAGVKGSHAQTGMQHIRAFVQSSLHLDNRLPVPPAVKTQSCGRQITPVPPSMDLTRRVASSARQSREEEATRANQPIPEGNISLFFLPRPSGFPDGWRRSTPALPAGFSLALWHLNGTPAVPSPAHFPPPCGPCTSPRHCCGTAARIGDN